MEGTSRFQEQKRLWLKAACDASGRTQADIAPAMGITPANLSALLNGHKPITDNTMDKAVAALNLELPDLGVRVKLPLPPSPVALDGITAEMLREFASQARTNNNLLNTVVEDLRTIKAKVL